MLPDLAARISASADIFDHRGRRPWASVNFITAHDGFTLADLVSYNDKHNEANQEENRDGHSENFSFNFGAEGPTEDAAILAAREQQKRNFLATLLLSQGTPMLLAGDEIGHSQSGNSNAYCQDNEITWLKWGERSAPDEQLLTVTRRLIALRKAHPVLRRMRFLHGTVQCRRGIKDLIWFTPQGTEKTPEQWRDPLARCIGVLLNGQAGPTLGPRGLPVDDGLILIIVNSHHEAVEFTLPQLPLAGPWRKMLDTATPDEAGETELPIGSMLPAQGRSLIVLRLPAERGA
jgi:isoamylase